MFLMPTTRRNFIEQSVAGALTSALAAKSSALAAPQNSAVTVGVIGAGIRGLEVMQAAISVGAKIVMVYDFDLQDAKLSSAAEGTLSGKTLAGIYKTAAEGSVVDEGTWKTTAQ